LSSSMSRWFETRREVRVIGLIRKHAKLTFASTDELVKGTEAAVKGKKNEVEISYQSQTRLDKEADALRKEIIMELSKGYLAPEDRADLITLAREVNWILDYAHEAESMLVLIDLSTVPKKIQDGALEMCKMVRDGAKDTVECIRLLADKKLDEALSLSNDVERLEEEVDEKYLGARKIMSELGGPQYKAGQLIILSQFLEAIENVADRCEFTIDQVRAMIVHLRK
jgi:predicted phosphate transport protein (TIGR00153 family)